MNTCPNNLNIKCPYALSIDSPLPCFGTQEQCDEIKAEQRLKENK